MVLGERSKKMFIVYLVVGTAALIVAPLTHSPEKVTRTVVIAILGVVMLLFGVYGMILPKNAIVKDDENIVMRRLFIKKVIPISSITKVWSAEAGGYSNNGGSSGIGTFGNMHKFTVCYKVNGKSLETSVFINDGAAAKTAFDSLLKNKNAGKKTA